MLTTPAQRTALDALGYFLASEAEGEWEKWRNRARSPIDTWFSMEKDRPTQVTGNVALILPALAILGIADTTLLAERDELRQALRPLANLHHDRLDRMSDDAPIYQHADAEVTVGDIRKARAVLAKEGS
jgi:hypothetical protein